jgi:hypothetical protein
LYWHSHHSHELTSHKNYYETTSFKSEIPASYFSIKQNWWGNTLQSPSVNYTKAIKGASFLARNCDAKNNRNDVVTKLIEAGFPVFSFSSCLHNANVPPGVNLANKTNVMEQYLFHLAFENGRVDDYVTEKLWMAFHAGTIPVVLGPTNIKEHVGSFHGAIYVDDFPTVQDLAKYLIQVSNNQTLYESYHAWRKEPYPDEFIRKYNYTRVHNTCRLCRWAFAKKYGLGWDHDKQTIEPVALSRDTCVDSDVLNSPVIESWWDVSDGKLHKLKTSPLGKTQGSLCPVVNDTIVTSRIGNGELIRSVWSHDGTTDLYLEGILSKAVVLKLQLPIANLSMQLYEENTIWFQNEQSRISLVFHEYGPGKFYLDSPTIINPSSDGVEILIHPSNLPMRIRIILEDQDTFHKGAIESQTYYGMIMTDDVLRMPELFALEPN